ncbi:protease propeptide/inhibitor [Rickenella mellea]|uniref:Protease propeptide/inhibitor n=1 Tax=Rickenella mellea TaxID=50990 RepID=A0A4Y7QBP5_9AGAM|nr:protease propeptide/inhibitor [Rickenella mellea]
MERVIVVFKDHVTDEQISKYIQDVNSGGGSVGHRYDSVLKGFSATITPEIMSNFQSLQGDVIDYIEPDGVVTTQ